MRSYIKPRKSSKHVTWKVPDLYAAYGMPTGLPGGVTIAILELGGGWIQSDVDANAAAVGQPSPSIVDVSVTSDGSSGSNNRDPTDPASGEVMLDIVLASQAYCAATGHAAEIKMYWAPNTANAIADCIDAIVADAKAGGYRAVISCSWGQDESGWTPEGLDALEAAILAAVNAGVPFFAAAGDAGADDGGGTLGVDAPASCTHAIGCGGTTKTHTSETVWNDNPGSGPNEEATGGGYSRHFPPSPWQVGSLVGSERPHGLGRMVPDVSANADPATGYPIVLEGRSQVVGGTSAVAPFWAGIVAAICPPSGWLGESLWASNAFADITVGDNGYYRAGHGPDPCTGKGVPHGLKTI